MFAAVSILWGLPYLFIKIAVDDGIGPIFLAWARVVLGGGILCALAWRAGVLGGLRERWRWLVAYAVIEITLPFPLIGFGEQRVPSSLAAIVIASAPLLMALLALRFDPDERVSGSRLVGLLVGLAGVVVLLGIDVAGSASALLGTGAILLAALGYAIGPMMLKHRLEGLDARAVMGVPLLLAAALLTPAAAFDIPDTWPTTEALVSIAVLGLLCTAAAFWLMTELVREVGPGRALVITYVNPVVAVILGVIVLGERPGPGAVAGLALILAGSWLSTRSPEPPGGPAT